MSCVIVGCTSHSSRKNSENETESISFHRFPTDDAMRQKWIAAVARNNWHWKKQHRICSKHFKDEYFSNIEYKWRRLTPNAVPSLHLRSERNILPTSSTTFNAEPTSSTISMSEVEQTYLNCRVSRLEKYNERLQKVAKHRLLKINSLRQKIRRLKKKNIDLHTRLINLLKKGRIKAENF